MEKFLLARRMMYWLVYLHKASLAAENTLIKVLKRAKYLANKGANLPGTLSIKNFLENKIDANNLSEENIRVFFSDR